MAPGLGCCLLLLLLLLGGSAGQGPQAEEAAWGRARYEAVKKHLGAVGALSKQYWRYLACRLWQEGCGEEEEEEMEDEESRGNSGWRWLLVGEDCLDVVSAWYCSFGKCCKTGDCRIVNNITGLEADLDRQLHGQHLAKEIIVQAVRGFLQSPRPRKALVLSFHGWSGTGKNFVTRLLANHLYRDGLKSECVRVFISLFHFPHHNYVDTYKAQLEKQISETVQLCQQSLFIFDEAEKLHFSLLDAIKPFMAQHDNQGDYRRSIFLFLSNLGGNTINEVALDFWRAGRVREEISMEYLEQRLRLELLEPAENGYARSHLLKEDLIDFFVPFLPLEYQHVKLCVRDAFSARGLPYTEAALDEVARMMVFVPKEEKLFSAQGCKSVAQRINYFLP
ncbi:torsin-3A [Phaenicophaeus curvirostris]|uniref:torsin-3A n=1 Tax=Phaenicophaeus curvirostris TaxID=33595 RepID=UPI0037F097DC